MNATERALDAAIRRLLSNRRWYRAHRRLTSLPSDTTRAGWMRDETRNDDKLRALLEVRREARADLRAWERRKARIDRAMLADRVEKRVREYMDEMAGVR